MPPRLNSRYMGCEGVLDDQGRMFLTEREPFRYNSKLPGTRKHRVSKGETLFTLAFRYFNPMPDAEHLWWILCEFQPDPILDPTLDLEEQRIVHVPSYRIVHEQILGV